MAQEMMGETQESAASEPVYEVEETDITFTLHHKTFTHEGKLYNDFFIPIKVLGREMEIKLSPKEGDRNAYFILDQLYKTHDVVELVCAEGTRMEGKKKTKFMTYLVKFFDPALGIEVAVPLRPLGDTNKRLLEQMYRQRLSQSSAF